MLLEDCLQYAGRQGCRRRGLIDGLAGWTNEQFCAALDRSFSILLEDSLQYAGIQEGRRRGLIDGLVGWTKEQFCVTLDRSFSMLLEDFIQGLQGDREGGGDAEDVN